MRLLSQKSREYKDKSYYKFWVVIPNKIVEKLGWKQGQELEAEVKDKKLIIEKDWKDLQLCQKSFNAFLNQLKDFQIKQEDLQFCWKIFNKNGQTDIKDKNGKASWRGSSKDI